MAKATPISWQAEEYIIREHHVGWYFGLLFVTLCLGAIAVWKEWWSFLVLIIVADIAVIVSNLKPPRKIKYSLNDDGLTEGNQLHKFSDFRAFGILKEGSHFSAILIPKKRFSLSVKIYFPEGKGEAIVDALGARLPMETVKQDYLDKIVNFLRI